MRVLAFTFTVANATRAWTVDEDCILRAAQCSSGNAVISDDPSLTVALFQTPAAAGTRFDIISYLSSGSAVGAFPPSQLNLPLSKDKTIFIANSSATAVVMLFLEP
jgi:hypothetical protein